MGAGVTEALADAVIKTGALGETCQGSHVLLLLCADARDTFADTCKLFAVRVFMLEPRPLSDEEVREACMWLASLDKDVSDQQASNIVDAILASVGQPFVMYTPVPLPLSLKE